MSIVDAGKIANWARLLLFPEGRAIENPGIGSQAFELGLKIDAGEKFENRYGVSCFDLEGLERVLPEVDDAGLLGSLAFSQWRGITHWGFHGEDSRACLQLTLARIVELTEA